MAPAPDMSRCDTDFYSGTEANPTRNAAAPAPYRDALDQSEASTVMHNVKIGSRAGQPSRSTTSSKWHNETLIGTQTGRGRDNNDTGPRGKSKGKGARRSLSVNGNRGRTEEKGSGKPTAAVNVEKPPSSMTRLEPVLERLALVEYLDAFVAEGFDTWETLQDITEADLDALGVKRGHRRKLQREIASARGVSTQRPLRSPSPSRKGASDDRLRGADELSDAGGAEVGAGIGASAQPGKRKYRRHPKVCAGRAQNIVTRKPAGSGFTLPLLTLPVHPKVDENAPARPPSAYVIFSNKMRENLKGQNLSFTEIAKLVGQHWQDLSAEEKASYESQAALAKQEFNRQLLDYKRTENYQDHLRYLAEFRAKHGAPTTEGKRARREPDDVSMVSATSAAGSRVSSSVQSSGLSRLDLDPSEPSQAVEASQPGSSSASSSSSRPQSPLALSSSPPSMSTHSLAPVDVMLRFGQPRQSYRAQPDASPTAASMMSNPYAIRPGPSPWPPEGTYRSTISESAVTERPPRGEDSTTTTSTTAAYRPPRPPRYPSGAEKPRALSQSTMPVMAMDPPSYSSREQGVPDFRRAGGSSHPTSLRHVATTSSTRSSSITNNPSTSSWSTSTPATELAMEDTAVVDHAYAMSSLSGLADSAEGRFKQLPPPILPPLRMQNPTSYESSRSSRATVSLPSMSTAAGEQMPVRSLGVVVSNEAYQEARFGRRGDEPTYRPPTGPSSQHAPYHHPQPSRSGPPFTGQAPQPQSRLLPPSYPHGAAHQSAGVTSPDPRSGSPLSTLLKAGESIADRESPPERERDAPEKPP
ncbi:MAG: hypothetical protein M1815_000457 [Lichina confinis]|nr:MAG: hypothetical protein M1815_000457 [Lichina confinis]